MHFTIDRRRFVKMLETVRRRLPTRKEKDQEVRIYACAARVFVEANSVTVGEEAMVLKEGSCFQPIEPFLALIKSYRSKPNITIEADAESLRVFSSVRNVLGYTRYATPPADFVVGAVQDTLPSLGDAQSGRDRSPKATGRSTRLD
jgi:hypothetical protein